MNKSLLLPLALTVISVVGVDAQVTDLEEVRLLAEQGDAIAQYNLGLMSASGRGVPEDDVEAVRWFRLAADQGYAIGQYNLGLMYYNGDGVPEDDVEGCVGFDEQPSKGLRQPSTASGLCMRLAKASQRTMWRRCAGIG